MNASESTAAGKELEIDGNKSWYLLLNEINKVLKVCVVPIFLDDIVGEITRHNSLNLIWNDEAENSNAQLGQEKYQ